MTRKIIIYYFPAGMRYASWLLPALCIWLGLGSYIIWCLIVLLIFLVIISTRYITVLDIERKVFVDYIFLLGLKVGVEQSHYQTIRGITIARSAETQHVRSRIQDRQFQWASYTATLHFDNDQTLDLITSVSLETVKQEAKSYADFLGTQLLG